MGVSKNSGTPKSSILIGFSIIFTIHFGVPLFLETPIYIYDVGKSIIYEFHGLVNISKTVVSHKNFASIMGPTYKGLKDCWVQKGVPCCSKS